MKGEERSGVNMRRENMTREDRRGRRGQHMSGVEWIGEKEWGDERRGYQKPGEEIKSDEMI